MGGRRGVGKDREGMIGVEAVGRPLSKADRAALPAGARMGRGRYAGEARAMSPSGCGRARATTRGRCAGYTRWRWFCANARGRSRAWASPPATCSRSGRRCLVMSSTADNNLVENAIRPTAVGKKNWLFIGHPDAGRRAAILYSLHRLLPAPRQRPRRLPARHLARLPAMTNQDDLVALTPRR